MPRNARAPQLSDDILPNGGLFATFAGNGHHFHDTGDGGAGIDDEWEISGGGWHSDAVPCETLDFVWASWINAPPLLTIASASKTNNPRMHASIGRPVQKIPN